MRAAHVSTQQSPCVLASASSFGLATRFFCCCVTHECLRATIIPRFTVHARHPVSLVMPEISSGSGWAGIFRGFNHVFAIGRTPFGHDSHDRTKRLTQGGQAILRFWRDDREFFARDQAAVLQFSQFFGQNAIADGRASSSDLREAKWFIPDKRPDDSGFPFAAQNARGKCHGALRFKFHGRDTNK